MKKLHSKKITKQVMIIIALITLCNFAMPNFIYAVSTEDGGSALEPIVSLLCVIPDGINNLLQNTFVTKKKIKGPNVSEFGDYVIKYSPGIIFSGKLPALDINFINPMDANVEEIVEETMTSDRFLTGGVTGGTIEGDSRVQGDAEFAASLFFEEVCENRTGTENSSLKKELDDIIYSEDFWCERDYYTYDR